MKNHTNRWIAVGTLGVLSAATLGGLGTTAANANAAGRRDLALGAAAVGVYGLLDHKPGLAIAGAVGAGVAYHNYRAAEKREERRDWRDRRYGDNHRYYDYHR